MSTTGGTKHDLGKPMVSLLDSQWLLGTAAVLTFGAKKYAPHNWRAGFQYSRLMDALQRHLLAFNGGEDLDQETGLSHLHHASCCLMFLSSMKENRPDLDDRFKEPKWAPWEDAPSEQETRMARATALAKRGQEVVEAQSGSPIQGASLTEKKAQSHDNSNSNSRNGSCTCLSECGLVTDTCAYCASL